MPTKRPSTNAGSPRVILTIPELEHAKAATLGTLISLHSRRAYNNSRGIHGRVRFRGSRWQGEVERRSTAAVAVAVGPDPAALRFDDRLTDCQAHAAALRLRRKECVEYLVDLAYGQPGPRIINRNFDLAVRIRFRLHRKHSAGLLHRLDTIEH